MTLGQNVKVWGYYNHIEKKLYNRKTAADSYFCETYTDHFYPLNTEIFLWLFRPSGVAAVGNVLLAGFQ